MTSHAIDALVTVAEGVRKPLRCDDRRSFSLRPRPEQPICLRPCRQRGAPELTALEAHLLDAARQGQGGMLLECQRMIERAVNDAHHGL